VHRRTTRQVGSGSTQRGLVSYGELYPRWMWLGQRKVSPTMVRSAWVSPNFFFFF